MYLFEKFFISQMNLLHFSKLNGKKYISIAFIKNRRKKSIVRVLQVEPSFYLYLGIRGKISAHCTSFILCVHLVLKYLRYFTKWNIWISLYIIKSIFKNAIIAVLEIYFIYFLYLFYYLFLLIFIGNINII